MMLIWHVPMRLVSQRPSPRKGIGKCMGVSPRSMGYVRALLSAAVAATLFILVASPTNVLAQGSAEDGEIVFRKCKACHSIGEGAKNLVGPLLNGVIGRRAGTIEGYSYSELNKSAGANGLEWNEERIFVYLEDPSAFLKKFLVTARKPELAEGQTKMPFKLPDKDDRNNIIAYLKKFSTGK